MEQIRTKLSFEKTFNEPFETHSFAARKKEGEEQPTMAGKYSG